MIIRVHSPGPEKNLQSINQSVSQSETSIIIYLVCQCAILIIIIVVVIIITFIIIIINTLRISKNDLLLMPYKKHRTQH